MSFFCSSCDQKMDCIDSRTHVGVDDLPFTSRRYKCGHCKLRLITEEHIMNYGNAAGYANGSPREAAGRSRQAFEKHLPDGGWESISWRASGLTVRQRHELKNGAPFVTSPHGFEVRYKPLPQPQPLSLKGPKA